MKRDYRDEIEFVFEIDFEKFAKVLVRQEVYIVNEDYEIEIIGVKSIELEHCKIVLENGEKYDIEDCDWDYFVEEKDAREWINNEKERIECEWKED